MSKSLTTPDLTAEQISQLPLADSVEHIFQTFSEKMDAVANEFSGLEVTDISQLEKMEEAKKAKKFCVKLRTAIVAEHKRLKEHSLSTGRRIDACKNAALDKLKPMEDWLEAQATYAERLEADLRRAVHSQRLALLEPFALMGIPADLSVYDEEQFGKIVEEARTVAEAREKAEETLRLREQERLAEERRVREENERLRRENEAAAVVRKQQEAHEEELRKEREAAAAVTRAAEEKARKEREAAQAKADAALRAEQAKAAEARRLLEEAEAVKRREEEKIRAAAEAAARAPDREKLQALGEALRVLAGGFELSLPMAPQATAIRRMIGDVADECDILAEK